jgi:hypothetical protein
VDAKRHVYIMKCHEVHKPKRIGLGFAQSIQHNHLERECLFRLILHCEPKAMSKKIKYKIKKIKSETK